MYMYMYIVFGDDVIHTEVWRGCVLGVSQSRRSSHTSERRGERAVETYIHDGPRR